MSTKSPIFNPGTWAGHKYDLNESVGFAKVFGVSSPRRHTLHGTDMSNAQAAKPSTCGIEGSLQNSVSTRSVPSQKGSQASHAKKSGSSLSKVSNEQHSGQQHTSKRSPRQTRSNASTKSSITSRSSQKVETMSKYCESDVSLASYKNAGTEARRIIFPKNDFSANYTPRDAAENVQKKMYYRSLRRCPGAVTARSMESLGEITKPRPATARQAKYEAQVQMHGRYEYCAHPITTLNAKEDWESSRKKGYTGIENFTCPSTRTEVKHPHMSTFGGYYAKAPYGWYYQRQNQIYLGREPIGSKSKVGRGLKGSPDRVLEKSASMR